MTVDGDKTVDKTADDKAQDGKTVGDKAQDKAQPKPAATTVAAPVAKAIAADTADERRTQFLRVYLRHRVGEELDRLERGRVRYAAARRWTVTLSVLLLTGAAALGAVAAADASRRPLWGFLATVLAALATSAALYEAAFGFRRLARRSASGVALLHLLQAHGVAEGEDGVAAFVTEVESVLRHSD